MNFTGLNISKLCLYCLIDLLLIRSGILKLLIINLPSLNFYGFDFKFCRSKNHKASVPLRFSISLAISGYLEFFTNFSTYSKNIL